MDVFEKTLFNALFTVMDSVWQKLRSPAEATDTANMAPASSALSKKAA